MTNRGSSSRFKKRGDLVSLGPPRDDYSMSALQVSYRIDHSITVGDLLKDACNYWGSRSQLVAETPLGKGRWEASHLGWTISQDDFPPCFSQIFPSRVGRFQPCSAIPEDGCFLNRMCQERQLDTVMNVPSGKLTQLWNITSLYR